MYRLLLSYPKMNLAVFEAYQTSLEVVITVTFQPNQTIIIDHTDR